MSIEFLIKYLMKKTSAVENQQVEEWLNSDAKNQTYFDQLKEGFDQDLPEITMTDAEIAEDWQKVKRMATERKEETKRGQQRKLRRTWITRIAAILVLGIALSLVYFNTRQANDVPPVYSQSKKALSLSGQALALEDGTRVWLNKNSTLHFPAKFEKNRRMVRLVGEGYFEVKRDEKRPFTVQSVGVDIRVLGTSFNIYTKDTTRTKVTVNSGKVAVTTKDGKQRVELIKNEAGDFDSKSGKLVKKFNRDLNYLSWKTNELVFKKATMGQIVNDLQRHFKLNISCSPELRQKFSFNGTFKQQTLKEILQVLEVTLDVKAHYNKEAILIK